MARISSRSGWEAHWKGVWGLGTMVETPTVTRARRPWKRLPDGQHGAGQGGDPGHVLRRLGGQADHEVQLDRLPALGVGQLGGAQGVRLRDPLVDHLAQALRPGLGGEGQPRAPAPLHQLRQVHVEGVHAGAGQGDGQGVVREEVDRILQDEVDVLDVRAGEGEQGELAVPGVAQDRLRHLDDLLPRAHPAGAVDHVRLAEAAAPPAAAHDLDRRAVVHRLHVGHHGHRREGEVHHVRHPLLDRQGGGTGQRDDGAHRPVRTVLHAVEGGDVHPLDPGGGAQEGLPGRPPAGAPQAVVRLQQLGDRLFALADQEQVDEVRQGLRVGGVAAPGEDDGIVRPPLAGQQGHPGQVEDVQHVAVAELVGQGEPQQVEVPQRRASSPARRGAVP